MGAGSTGLGAPPCPGRRRLVLGTHGWRPVPGLSDLSLAFCGARDVGPWLWGWEGRQPGDADGCRAEAWGTWGEAGGHPNSGRGLLAPTWQPGIRSGPPCPGHLLPLGCDGANEGSVGSSCPARVCRDFLAQAGAGGVRATCRSAAWRRSAPRSHLLLELPLPLPHAAIWRTVKSPFSLSPFRWQTAACGARLPVATPRGFWEAPQPPHSPHSRPRRRCPLQQQGQNPAPCREKNQNTLNLLGQQSSF